MSHRQLFLLYLPSTVVLPTLLSWYLGRNLLGAPKRSRRATYTVITLMFLLGMSASLALMFWSEQDRTPIRPMIVWGFDVLGYLLTVTSLLLARDGLRLCIWLGSQWRRIRLRAAKPLKARHTSVGLPASTWLLCLLAGLSVYLGKRVAAQAPEVHTVRVAIRRLPEAFRGFRIAHLTDIHAHGSIDTERLRRLVHQVNSLRVDMLAITGDVVDGPLDDLRRELQPLSELDARHGVYLAVGNHESYADVDACVDLFESFGFHVLLNDHRVINQNGAQLVVAGVTNPQRGMHGAKYTLLQGRVAHMQSDAKVALRGAPLDVPRIFLAHQPKSVADARNLGVDLALAGHTHGGQFFPWNYAAQLIFPYVAGLYVDGSMQIYVGRGIGTFGPQLRLGSPPEIAIIELQAAKQ